MNHLTCSNCLQPVHALDNDGGKHFVCEEY